MEGKDEDAGRGSPVGKEGTEPPLEEKNEYAVINWLEQCNVAEDFDDVLVLPSFRACALLERAMGKQTEETKVVAAIAAMYTLFPEKVDMSQVYARRNPIVANICDFVRRVTSI
jgi:hypothetical protein